GLRVPFQELPTAPFASTPFELEGEPAPAGNPLPRGDFRPVSPDYFETVGLSLLSGRLFDEADRRDSPRVVIVNRALAKRHFGDRDPVGHRLAWRDPQAKYSPLSGDWRTIVGVVSDSKDYGVTAATPHVVYQPLAQVWVGFAGTLFVRTPNPTAVANQLTRIVRDLDPEQPIERVATLAEVYDERIGPQRLNATLLGGFGL